MLLNVKRAMKGDKYAFVELMEEAKIGMYKIARSYLSNEADIADVMQQTTLDCFEHIHQLKKASYFKTWMTRILINNCIDILKEKSNIVEFDEKYIVNCEQVSENLQDFWDVLEGIDDKYRTVMVLYYSEGFKTKEISKILGINESTIRSWLQRGRECYKNLMLGG